MRSSSRLRSVTLLSSSLLPVLLLAGAAALASACTPAETATPAAASPASSNASILPLRSLRLYETGVGYFERSGAVGAKVSALPVPAGHLDDALKSLVVLNGGAGGHVTGVAFTSSVTRATARTRAGLPQDPDEPIAFRDLLASMKGERVVITRKVPAPVEAVQPREEHGQAAPPAPATEPTTVIDGRVVEVMMEDDLVRARALLQHKDAKLDETPKRLVVSVLTTHGEVMQLAAEDIATIRPVDPAFATRLDAAMDALSTRNAQNSRALELLGDARGEVTFGYIAETPLWRTSYRLIVGEKAELQGWALVHNDTDENWQGVHLELVNGEPDSFVFPIAAPRYARRNLVTPDVALSTLPQLGSTTADALWGEHLDGHGAGTGSGQGYGSGHGRLGGSHTTKSPSVRMGAVSSADSLGASSVLSVGNLAELAPASGTEQGALFVYAVPTAFSLPARSSALVPFVKKNVEVESISFFGSVGEKGRATLRFVNGTGQTLPSGTISVFSGGGFTGETSLDRLKPGERRFLEIGNDLDTEVTEKKSQKKEESKRLTFDFDRMEEHFIRASELSWEVENRSGQPRTFYVALAASQNAKVTGADRVDFDEVQKRAIAVFVVPPKTKAVRTFTVTEGLSKSVALTTLTEKSLKLVLAKTSIAAADLATLAQSLDKVRAMETELKNVLAADKVVDAAKADLERLREDLKALGGGGNNANAGGVAATPLVKRMVDAEDRVGAAQKAHETAVKTLEDRREAVREALKKLETRAP